jgi:hypothetical protein
MHAGIFSHTVIAIACTTNAKALRYINYTYGKYLRKTAKG